MSLSTAHLRAILEKPPMTYSPKAAEPRFLPRRALWLAPAPLPYLKRADPFVLLLLIAGVVAIVVTALVAIV